MKWPLGRNVGRGRGGEKYSVVALSWLLFSNSPEVCVVAHSKCQGCVFEGPYYLPLEVIGHFE